MNSGLAVERIGDVMAGGPDELLTEDVTSPFVWREPNYPGLMALVRAVPPFLLSRKRQLKRATIRRTGPSLDPIP